MSDRSRHDARRPSADRPLQVPESFPLRGPWVSTMNRASSGHDGGIDARVDPDGCAVHLPFAKLAGRGILQQDVRRSVAVEIAGTDGAPVGGGSAERSALHPCAAFMPQMPTKPPGWFCNRMPLISSPLKSLAIGCVGGAKHRLTESANTGQRSG